MAKKGKNELKVDKFLIAKGITEIKKNQKIGMENLTGRKKTKK